MAEFNDLLRGAGIQPEEVAVLRHHTPEPGATRQSLFELWREDRAGFELYQETQKLAQPLFRRRKFWAAFVSPARGETLFAGLYEASLRETGTPDWPCPYRGGPPGKGEVIDIFDTQLRPELAEYIGNLLTLPSSSVSLDVLTMLPS